VAADRPGEVHERAQLRALSPGEPGFEQLLGLAGIVQV
jgi:hypothetical protein